MPSAEIQNMSVMLSGTKKKSPGRTLQASHHAVEALGTQLVVAKRAEKLADDDVGLFWRVE